jgi:ribosome-associated protein
MQVEEIKNTAIAALDEIKASDIVVLDVTKLTSLFDYMIVASGESARQNNALARNVQDKVKACGGYVLGSEGSQTGEWVLVDLGGVVVHIMQPVIRDYYNLEQLWGGEPPRRASGLRRATERPADAGADARA